MRRSGGHVRADRETRPRMHTMVLFHDLLSLSLLACRQQIPPPPSPAKSNRLHAPPRLQPTAPIPHAGVQWGRSGSGFNCVPAYYDDDHAQKHGRTAAARHCPTQAVHGGLCGHRPVPLHRAGREQDVYCVADQIGVHVSCRLARACACVRVMVRACVRACMRACVRVQRPAGSRYLLSLFLSFGVVAVVAFCSVVPFCC